MGVMGRYPLHFHIAGDLPHAIVKKNSFHNTFQRCISIHGSSFVTLQDSVAFNIFSHCYFLEDAAEDNNVIDHNVGITVRRVLASQCAHGIAGSLLLSYCAHQ
jgi:hypothetical protein